MDMRNGLGPSKGHTDVHNDESKRPLAAFLCLTGRNLGRTRGLASSHEIFSVGNALFYVSPCQAPGSPQDGCRAPPHPCNSLRLPTCSVYIWQARTWRSGGKGPRMERTII